MTFITEHLQQAHRVVAMSDSLVDDLTSQEALHDHLHACYPTDHDHRDEGP